MRFELDFAGDGESVSSYVLTELRPGEVGIVIGDISVRRFLVPQLSLTSGPGSGTGQEQQRIRAGLQISLLYHRESAWTSSYHLLLLHWRAVASKTAYFTF